MFKKTAIFLFGVFLLANCRQDPPIPKPSPSTVAAPAKPATPVLAYNDPNSTVPEEPFIQEGKLAVFAPDGKKILKKFDIEIADVVQERNKGLMFRRKMLPERGMLFLFEFPEPQSFWMRNTYIPLDIIYIDDQLTVVSIQKNCRILNDTPLPSGKPAQYVLEINGGLSDKLGIAPGSKVAWRNFVSNQHKGVFEEI